MIENALSRFNSDYKKRFFNFLILMVIIWIVTLVIVKVTGMEKPVLDFLKGTIGKTPNSKTNFLPLFWHNFSGALLVIIIGIIPIPLYYLAIIENALSVGLLLGVSNNPVMIFITGLLPHGIFEVPGQLISAAISARLVWFMIDKYIRHRRVETTLKQMITTSAVDTVVYALPLFLIASIIETYITPILLGLAR